MKTEMKMNDLEAAIKNLEGHTLALCKDGSIIVSDKRGVAPMVDFLREGRELSGYCAADRVVGKATAMLFVKAGIKEVYAEVISESAEAFLKSHGIVVSFGKRTEHIMNRAKNGPCPMESLVEGIDDIKTGVVIITNKLDEMRAAK